MLFKFFSKENQKQNKNRLASKQGQVAVIMIFIIAVALIFYAVSLNLGKLSQTKTTVTIASNTAASTLGSLMASYAQSLLETTLGGDDKVCGFTGLLAALLIVIVIILIIVTYGGAAPAAAALGLGAGAAGVTALALITLAAVANLALQATVIQPGISELWNKIVSNNLSTRNQFLETTIQSALRTAVTDSKKVPDFTDLDADGIWQVGTTKPYADEVGRFAVYYTDRLQEITVSNTIAINEFQRGLQKFIEKETPDPLDIEFGLHDPIACPDAGNVCCYDPVINNSVPSFCNPCCLPDTVIDPEDGITVVDIRPECCDLPVGDEEKCGDWTQCAANSRFGPAHPWTYETYSEDFSNNQTTAQLSFRELLGRDDEHQSYFKAPPPIPSFWPASQSAVGFGSENFSIEDVSGYYSPPYYSPPADPLPGIFSFFYKVGRLDATLPFTPNLPRHYDWGFDLSVLDTTTLPDVNTRPDTYCFWYDTNFFPGAPCDTAFLPQELQNATFPLVLPRDPLSLSWNWTPHVDGISVAEPVVTSSGGSEGNPLALDRVQMAGISGINVEANDDECAQGAIYKGLGAPLGSDTEGFWKRGADRFCSTDFSPVPYNGWPYYFCPKHNWGTCLETFDDGSTTPAPCECGDTPGENNLWQDDILDDIVYGIPDFLEFAYDILYDSPLDIGDDIVEWYQDIADWVEPGFDAANGITGLPNCYFCNDTEDGLLVVMEKEITEIYNRMNALRSTSSFAGFDCTEVWCVPPTEFPAGSGTLCSEFVPAAERATFDVDGDAIQGDMDDVIACLDWNVNDFQSVLIYPGLIALPPPATGPVLAGPPTTLTVTGNAQKFEVCRQECSDSTCSILPRSLLPDAEFYPGVGTGGSASLSGYIPIPYLFDQPIVKQMIKCYDDCNDVNCRAMVNAGRDTAGLVSWPSAPGNPFDFFNEAVHCTVTGQHASGSRWPLMIQDNLDKIHPSCDLTFSDDLDIRNNGWLYNVGLSAIEAENQVAKMATRKEFLENRLEEIKDIEKIFLDASVAFQEFLYSPTGPVRELMDAVANWQSGGLPYHAIYGWKTYPDDDSNNDPLWHVVRADARVPGKCDTACGVSQTLNSDPAWPKVKTYTKGWGTSRCYELDNTSGVVKVRVARYDDNPKQNTLFFPNGVPIWDFKTLHPKNDAGGVINLDTSNIETSNLCGNLVKPSPYGSSVSEYEGAFILNRLIKGGASDNEGCWKKMQALLSRGVMSETCVKYYLHRSITSGTGMEMAFVPCQNF